MFNLAAYHVNYGRVIQVADVTESKSARGEGRGGGIQRGVFHKNMSNVSVQIDSPLD